MDSPSIAWCRARLRKVSPSPKFMMQLHLVLTVIWFLMIPLAIYTGWITSIVFVAAISIYANFAGHYSSYQAARTEARQAGDTNEVEE